jgi:hypothetical protein
MPSSEVMEDFRKHKLHSGKHGKIVRKKKQAKAILLSYLRKEGKIPERDGAGKTSSQKKKKGKTAKRKRTMLKR